MSWGNIYSVDILSQQSGTEHGSRKQGHALNNDQTLFPNRFSVQLDGPTASSDPRQAFWPVRQLFWPV